MRVAILRPTVIAWLLMMGLLMQMCTSEVAQSKQFIKQPGYNGLLCEMEVSFVFPISSSIISCAASCSKTSLCSSIFFNHYSEECFGTIISLPSIGGCRASNGSLFWAIPGGYNYPCSSDYECKKTNMECRWGKCACQLGFSHHPSSDTCVTECSTYGYGSTFQAHQGYYLSGLNIDCLPNSVLCPPSCITNPSCRSWEYNITSDECCTSMYTTVTAPGFVVLSHDEMYNHRDCA